MTKKNKKITILLAGGTVLLDKSKRLVAVQSADDIDLWLKQMPELNLFGEIEPIFIAGEDDLLGPNHWESMSKNIQARLDNSDAFIIISRFDQLLMTTAALTFLLQNIKKTIILTSSYLCGTGLSNKKELLGRKNDSGLRSNLINAFQVADYKLPSPAIMFGTRLVPGIKAIRDYNSEVNYFASQDNNYWGRVDFGISIKSGLEYYPGKAKVYNNFTSRILLVEDMPYIEWPSQSPAWQQAEAIFIKINHQNKLEPEKIALIKDCQQPVFLYHPIQVQDVGEAIAISTCTVEMALAKTMWAMANQDQISSIKQVMEQNLVGEFYSL